MDQGDSSGKIVNQCDNNENIDASSLCSADVKYPTFNPNAYKCTKSYFSCFTKKPLNQCIIGLFFSFVTIGFFITGNILNLVQRKFRVYHDNSTDFETIYETVGMWTSCVHLSVGKRKGCEYASITDWWVFTMCQVGFVTLTLTSPYSLIALLKIIFRVVKYHNYTRIKDVKTTYISLHVFQGIVILQLVFGSIFALILIFKVLMKIQTSTIVRR